MTRRLHHQNSEVGVPFAPMYVRCRELPGRNIHVRQLPGERSRSSKPAALTRKIARRTESGTSEFEAANFRGSSSILVAPGTSARVYERDDPGSLRSRLPGVELLRRGGLLQIAAMLVDPVVNFFALHVKELAENRTRQAVRKAVLDGHL